MKPKSVKRGEHTPSSSDATEGGTPPAKPSPSALSAVGEKWTPGPWAWGSVVDEVNPGSPEACELVAYGPPEQNGDQLVTTILELEHDGTQATIRITAANAHLIIAAPELYEALEQFVRATSGGPMTLGECAQFARAALAKARGETDAAR